ncbi:restriction endonuclease subunit S [Erythrobacter aquimaris]|uniref:Restriction endonuclease subunit S n=1 Tax=Qipengyuania aquimaris TaxID=255984 RepID=A0A6I4TS41_9SPHN|nr:restriction endonuclease subunit S [Qipengyuania aquimaris]MXO97233.1 restriction endonuclease subunit S [Qipengyuania aquimaris]
MDDHELPAGWAAATVDDLGEYINGCAFKPTDWHDTGTPIVRIQNLTDPDKRLNVTQREVDPKYHIGKRDILVSWSATLDVFRWGGPLAYVNQHIFKVLPTEHLDDRFVEFALKKAISELINSEHLHGSTMKHINRKPFLAHPINVPPFPEQQRIVEKIETLFAELDKGEEALREVQKLLARYRQSVLKAAVTGTLTAYWRAANGPPQENGADLLARILKIRRETWQGRGKYKEPAEPDTAGLPELPEGWVWATMPMLGEFGRGKSKHRPRGDPKLYKGGKYPFLQTGRVRNSSGRISEYDKLYSDFGLAQSKLWPAGTVCITIAANIAESGILEIDACFPDSVVGLVPHEDIEGSYIELFIRTAKADLDRFAPATAQKNINLDTLNNVAVPLPPAEEQKEIADKVTTLVGASMVIERGLERELERSAALRQSILKDAFSGKLVPQDPSDQPAEKLLERIRTARAEKPKAKRKKAAA